MIGAARSGIARYNTWAAVQILSVLKNRVLDMVCQRRQSASLRPSFSVGKAVELPVGEDDN